MTSLADFLISGVSPGVQDVFTPLGYTPHAKQQKFHEMSRERVGAILFGGAAGGGKSCALLMEAIHCAVNFPNMRIACIRRTYNELNESFLAELRKRGYAKSLGAKWNQTQYMLRFPNGSEINFTYAENEIDASRLLGGEYQLFCVDEAGLMPSVVIQHIEERLRSGSRGLPVIGLRLSCLDEGDVLTEKGWKPIQDVALGDGVYSVSPAGHLELKPVIDTFAGYTSKDLVRVRSRGLYMSMTDDHRVVYQDEQQRRATVQANSRTRTIDPTYRIIPWNQHDKRTISIARTPLSYDDGPGVDNPFDFADPDDWASFLGLFLAEGCTNTTPRNGSYKVIITQCKPENQQPIKDLLNRLPYRYNLSKNGDFQITNKALWTYLRQFGKAHEKHVPRDVLNQATVAQLELLWKWMAFGDGHLMPSRDPDNEAHGIVYITVSPQLADDVCEIAIKLGHRVSVTKTELDNPNHRDRYTVSVLVGNHPTTRVQKNTHIDHTTKEPFNGMVYCIKVQDNENFVVRQGGTVWISGNTNPGGPSHKYLKDRFITPTNYGGEIVVDGDDRTVAFIQSKYTDNPYVDKGYEKILNAIPDENRRAAMRDGDWDAMLGAFFSSFQRMRHVVPAFDVPSEWQRYCGVDYGFRDPFAAEWGAVDNDGRVWMYREIYATEVDAPNQARLIVEAEKAAGEHDVVRVADPSMWGARGTPLTIADIYGMEGCGIAKADNDRLNGWSRFHYYLAEAPACDYHRSIEGWGDTCPLIHFMEHKVPNLIEAIPNLPRSKTRPDDAETRLVDDHGIDATRYLLMMAGTNARPVFYNDIPSDTAQRAHQEEAQAAFAVPSYNDQLVEGRYAGNLGPRF